jgi:hypothetical protein
VGGTRAEIGRRPGGRRLTVDLNQVAPSQQPYHPARRPYPKWNRILSLQANDTWAKNLANFGGDAPPGFAPEVISARLSATASTSMPCAATSPPRGSCYPLPFAKGNRGVDADPESHHLCA